jgi:DNA repair exonuclease SbcCD ATPase subunit
MFLVAGPTPEFFKFMQILCWIIIPVLVLIVLVTVFLHYRKKRKSPDKENDAITKDEFMQASPEQVGYTNGDGQYVLFDHSSLIKEYKNRLLYSHACIAALEKDLNNSETKYAALAGYVQTNFITTKKETMENLQPEAIRTAVNKLAKEQEMERNEWLTKLNQLERSYQQLEQENKTLQEQISMETATDDEKAAIINRWKEENNSLREKVAGQEYLEDLLQEKKAQINFLQNQMEQRIKDLYRSEHIRLQTVAEMKQVKEDSEAIRKKNDALENDLLIRQEEADKMQVVLCAKEEQLVEKQQLLDDRISHITYVEGALRETKEQNDQLNASVADSRDLVNTLQQQLLDEQAKVEFTVQKLFDNKQLLRRLYKELSNFIDDDSKGSPVVSLRPAYSNIENEETAV